MKMTRVFAGSLAAAAVAVFAAPALAAADPVVPTTPAKLLDGKTVFVDPGSSISSAVEQARKVTNGRGGTAACVNPVAVAANGTADHTVNLAVAKMVEAALKSQGAKVIMSRVNDTGFAGCVDERATKANTSGADLAVSINSAIQDAAKRGFMLETAAPGATDPKVTAQQAVSVPASTVVRNTVQSSGFVPAQYFGGTDGIAQTTNPFASLVNIPTVFANLGNLANPADAALLTSTAGQTQYAAALVNGVIQQLTGKIVPGAVVDQDVQQPVTPTAPTATTPAATAPTQTPIVPAVPGAPAAATPVQTTGTSPIVPGVPMLQGGATPGAVTAPSATVPTATAPAPQNTTVSIPGLGQLTLPQLPQITLPGQSQPVGLNTLVEMGPKAADFLSSSQGQQLISALMSSPQAFNSLQSAQGPAAAQEILKAILSVGAVLPK